MKKLAAATLAPRRRPDAGRLRLDHGRPERAGRRAFRPGYRRTAEGRLLGQLLRRAPLQRRLVTLIGPAELTTLDKESARQLRRDMRSMITGPRATLVLYEKQFLSARSVGFQPGTREASLVEKLGFGGRIESMQLRCG